MRWFSLFAVVALVLIGVAAWAQGPPVPPSCEQQLSQEMLQGGEALRLAGALKQQLGLTRAQVEAVTKERDALKAELATLKPKKDTEKK